MLVQDDRDCHEGQSPAGDLRLFLPAPKDEDDVADQEDQEGEEGDGVGGDVAGHKLKKVVPKG